MLKPYGEYKAINLPWLSSIPGHWEITRNKNVLSLKSGKLGSSSESYTLLSLTKQGVIARDMVNTKGKFPKDFDTYQAVQKGEIIFCMFDIDETPRSVGLSYLDGMITGAYSVFRIQNILPRYIYYYYISLDNGKLLKPLYTGLRKTISTDTFLTTKLPLPPENEQKQIVRYLDFKIAKINKLVGLKKKEIELLKEYRQAVITKAVTKGLDENAKMKDSGVEWIGEIPEGWGVVPGKHLFTLRNHHGNSIELRLLSPTQKYGVIPQSKYDEISGMSAVKISEDSDLSTFRTIHRGDYCISLRSFQGGFEYSEYEGVVSPAYKVFYSNSKINHKYYKFLFKEIGFIAKMNSYTMTLRDGKNISFDNFKNTYLPVPPLSQQKEIAYYLENKCTSIDKSLIQKEILINKLQEYKTRLISDVVTGKLDVRGIQIEDLPKDYTAEEPAEDETPETEAEEEL